MSLPQTQQRAPTGQGSKMSASNLSGGPSSAIVGSARPREIRSSRRKLGSTGPAVVLGGGVGILGSGSSQREVQSAHPFYNTAKAASPHLSTSPQVPVDFSSPTGQAFPGPSPISPQFPNMYGPSSATSHSSPGMVDRENPGSSSSLSTAASTSSRTLKTPHSKADHTHAHQPSIVSSSGSHETEHNAEYDGPVPALPKDRLRQMTQMDDAWSPTPPQRYLKGSEGQEVKHTRNARGKTRSRAKEQSPTPQQLAVEQSPPTPPKDQAVILDRLPVSKERSQGSMPRGSPPDHLDMAQAHKRLSQDWVSITFPGPVTEVPPSRNRQAPPMLPKDSSNQMRGETVRKTSKPLPGPMMVPMKDDPSPSRPHFERANSAPPLPQVSDDKQEERAQRPGRGSLDQLRSNSGEPPRARQNSQSTPPAAIIEAASNAAMTSASVNRVGLFGLKSKGSSPPLEPGRVDALKSADSGRPSLSSGRTSGKAVQQQQQRALGLGSANSQRPDLTESPAPVDMERKSSGISLKKSSGALKALFNRGASGKKDRTETPPPLPAHLAQDGRLRGASRTSSSSPRPRTPGSPTSTALGLKTESDVIPSRSSFGAERAMYPAPALQRTRSQGNQPVVPNTGGQPMIATRSAGGRPPNQRLPSAPIQNIRTEAMPMESEGKRQNRDLPPLPPVSPIPPAQGGLQSEYQPEALVEAQKIGMAALRGLPENAPLHLKLSTLAEALPTTSLPYLTPASFGLDKDIHGVVSPQSQETRDQLRDVDTGSTSSNFGRATARDVPLVQADSSSIPANSAKETDYLDVPTLSTYQSLHLLQLPILDLDFDLSFEQIGISPSTPRKSPQKSRLSSSSRTPPSPTLRRSSTARASPSSSSSPQRSLTTRAPQMQVSPRAVRANSERRRSKSFDGPTGGMTLGEVYRDIGDGGYTSPSMAKLFAPTSSSAPILSKPLEPSPTSSEESTLSPSSSSTPMAAPQVLASSPLLDHHSNPLMSTDQQVDREDSRVRRAKHAHRHPSRGRSTESHQSRTSSSEHARTPSNTSSTNETNTPSPPRTPPNRDRNLMGLGLVDDVPSDTVTPKPLMASALEDDAIEQRYTHGQPPSIPLPALPTVATAILNSPPSDAPVTITFRTTETEREKVATVNVKALIPAGHAHAGVAPPQARPPIVSSEHPAPEFNEEVPEPLAGVVKVAEVKKARVWKSILGANKSKKVEYDEKVGLRELGREMEAVLHAFRGPASLMSSGDRANLIRNRLLVTLNEIEKRPASTKEEVNRALREVAFDWAESLLYELRVEQAANERGACLEGLGSVLESSCLSANALSDDAHHRVRFMDLMMKCMTFVMGKLSAKGVFHNTLLFSGRFLAFAFFRIPHIGEQLVTVLPPPRGALMRFTRGSMAEPKTPASARPCWPEHLLPLCFDDSRKYTARLAGLYADFDTEEERDAFLFQPGNWLRRWQSDDSELFPAFYRAYHRQLALYLAPTLGYYEGLDRPLPAAVLLRAPGYAHLATIFAKKCHSYILGSINAVTTSSATHAFDATESAGLKGSQKPPVLETANRRLVETLSTLINTHVMIPDTKNGVIEVEGRQLWSSALNLWVKQLVTKTSLYAPKGVFSLFDLLDGVVDPPFDPVSGERQLREISLLDVPHLIHVVRLILTQGEHALTIVKVIAFVFTHWEVLTAVPDDRRELCLDLLLEKKLFERLTLFWSQSVRSYVLRLVVFRLGHVHTTKEDGLTHEVEIESVRLLQTRLDRIRKRYSELEPKDASCSTTDRDDSPSMSDGPFGSAMPRSKSTITMVSDSPKLGSGNKAERLLGLGLGSVDKTTGSTLDEDTSSKIGKAKGWLKKSFANKKRRKDGSLDSPLGSSPGNSPLLAASPQPDGPQSSSPLLPVPGIPGVGLKAKKSPKPTYNPIEQPANRSALAAAASVPPAFIDSPFTSSESHSPTSKSAIRSDDPPEIYTSLLDSSSESHDHEAKGGNGNGFAFEFELPTMSPRSDTFDPTPMPASPRRNSQPPSPRCPTSPHMSRSFSKRSSLLPPNTANILANEISGPGSSKLTVGKKEKEVVEVGYAPKLHAYAIRMLAELEDAQKEYDEWWAEGGIGKVDGAPPRLTVAWPFHEGDE